MTEDELRPIREREKAATKRPWKLFSAGTTLEITCDEKAPIVGWSGFDDCFRSPNNHKANAKFMTHAREDIPTLLDEIDRLNKIIADQQVEIDGT